MLDDDDLRKWEYPAHTEAKHRLLARYLKAWIPILGQGARRFGYESRLVLVDAFAGRGRYARGEPGSPLILREMARLASEDGKVDVVELYIVERNPANFKVLADELETDVIRAGTTRVVQHTPLNTTFEQAAPDIVAEIRRHQRSSFWFIDPFGFSGLPLGIIRSILALARSEVFITLMVRDMNRFVSQPNHQQAIASLLELQDNDLAAALAEIERSNNRPAALRDLYVSRLKVGANAKFARFYRIAAKGESDTVYYLVHGTNHAKGYREMKEASFEEGGWAQGFRGRNDPSISGQLDMFNTDPVAFVDMPRLAAYLLTRFAGMTIEYEALHNEAQPLPEPDNYLDRHIHQALIDLTTQKRIEKLPRPGRSGRGLGRGDRLRFPPS